MDLKVEGSNPSSHPALVARQGWHPLQSDPHAALGLARIRGGARLLYVGAFVSLFDRFSIAPLLIPIAGELRSPLAATAGAATLYYLLYGAMQPVYGLLSDRVGRVRVMRAALSGMAFAGLLSALAPNLPLLIVARAATGALAAAIVPTSLVYIGDTFPFRVRQQAIVDLMAATAAGTATATIVAGLLAQLASWRLAFALPALAAAALAAALKWMPETLQVQRQAGPLTQLRRVMKRPWALVLIGLAILEGSVILGLLIYLAPALEAHGYNPATAGLVVAGYGLSVFACTRIVKRLAQRAPAPALIGLGGGMLVAGYSSAALSQGALAILVAAVLVGGAFAFLHSTLQAWATDVVPEARGTATALFVAGVFAGGAFGAAAAAGLAGAHRFTTLFLLGVAVSLPLTVLCWFARSRYRESGPLPEVPVGIG